ncbi:hypothetical protein ANCDUO_10417, partial [Ancylostoma duodenale]
NFLHESNSNGAKKYIQIIFLDEKKFNLDGSDVVKSYWRKNPIVFSCRNFGGGSLMAWGAFCGGAKLESCRFQKYTIQQDNAAVHANQSTKTWLMENRMNVMDWPACSSDLNLMENLWAILARKLYSDHHQFHSIEELKTAIINARKDVEDDVLRNRIASLH